MSPGIAQEEEARLARDEGRVIAVRIGNRPPPPRWARSARLPA
jgi:hypothetical protein